MQFQHFHFGPHQARTYRHQSRHLRLLGYMFHFLANLFHDFYKHVLPAGAGSTILKIDTKHFEQQIHFLDAEAARIGPLWVTFFRTYRSFVPSVSFLVVPGPSLSMQDSSQNCGVAVYRPTQDGSKPMKS